MSQRQVFLVTEGRYERSVLSVWSTQALADAELERVSEGNPDECRVEPFWLDRPEPDDVPRWQVTFFTETSRVVRDDDGPVGEDRLDDRGRGPQYVQAPDAETALKIASEKRAEWLAQKGVTR